MPVDCNSEIVLRVSTSVILMIRDFIDVMNSHNGCGASSGKIGSSSFGWRRTYSSNRLRQPRRIDKMSLNGYCLESCIGKRIERRTKSSLKSISHDASKGLLKFSSSEVIW